MSDDDLEQRVEDAVDLAKQAMQYAGEMQDRVEDLEDEVHELREANERLRDQEQMFRDVRRNMQGSPEERAVICIKTLNNEALTNQQLDEPGRASMDRDAAKKTLGGELRRQQIHDAFDRAEDLVGDDDVLWKVSGDPGRGGTDTTLRLDLEAGDLPESVAGESIRQQPYGGAD